MDVGKGMYGVYSQTQKHGTPVQSIGDAQTERENRRKALDLEQQKIDLQREEKNKPKEAPQVDVLQVDLIPQWIDEDLHQWSTSVQEEMNRVWADPNLTTDQKNAKQKGMNSMTSQVQAYLSGITAFTKQIKDDDNLTTDQKDEAIEKLKKMYPGTYKTGFEIDESGYYRATMTAQDENGFEVVREGEYEPTMTFSYFERSGQLYDLQAEYDRASKKNVDRKEFNSNWNKEHITNTGYEKRRWNPGKWDSDKKRFVGGNDLSNRMLQDALDRGLTEEDAEKRHANILNEFTLDHPPSDGPGAPTDEIISPYRFKDAVVSEVTRADGGRGFRMSTNPNKDKLEKPSMNLWYQNSDGDWKRANVKPIDVIANVEGKITHVTAQVPPSEQEMYDYINKHKIKEMAEMSGKTAEEIKQFAYDAIGEKIVTIPLNSGVTIPLNGGNVDVDEDNNAVTESMLKYVQQRIQEEAGRINKERAEEEAKVNKESKKQMVKDFELKNKKTLPSDWFSLPFTERYKRLNLIQDNTVQ